MKLPKTFVPEKALDEKIGYLSRNFYKLTDLIEDEIGFYQNYGLLCPPESPYRYITLVAEHVRTFYHNTLEQNIIIEVMIFRLNAQAKDHIKELSGETTQGLLKGFEYTCCLTKDAFAMILISDTKEALELFKEHYQEKFGFC